MKLKNHAHEFTQYSIPRPDDIKIDENVTNVFKNIRDQLGSLNANIENYNQSSGRLGTIMAWLTGVVAFYSVVQIIIIIAK